MGLGLHGGGVAAANWFLRQRARVRITDLKTRAELQTSVKKIFGKPERYTLGKHKKEDFLWADIVVQNPGVPRESEYLKIARKNGAKIENEATIFFQSIAKVRIIGVTGTRGKSTTATLIYKILKKKFPGALIGGNIATSPMLGILERAKKTADPLVLELSSWHLENLGEKKLSPHVGVFTNFYPDHLNRYRTLKDYREAKENIFRFQNEKDFIVLNRDNAHTRALQKKVQGKLLWFSRASKSFQNGAYVKGKDVYFLGQRVLVKTQLKIIGEHNLENALAAVCVGKIFHVKNIDIQSALKSFPGLAYRLEFIRKFQGIRYYNDSAATTPDGAIAALKALGNAGGKNVILIAGGSDKGIPQEKFNELGKYIHKFCKAVILFAGTGSKKIVMSNVKCKISNNVTRMPDAVGIAKSLARGGDIVLLSPACASFGLFLHEFDRGDQFRNIVKMMKN